MALKWRKGEDPRLDRIVEAAIKDDDLRRGVSPESRVAAPVAKTWSSAKPTVGLDGIKYASKMEARVADRLREALRPGEKLVRQPSFPLLALEPGPDGKVKRFTPDFAVVAPTREPDDFVTAGWTWLSAEWYHSPSSEGKYAQAERGVWVRFVEAKGGRRSRDYALRRDAFAAVFGPVIEWDGTGSLPLEPK